MKKSFGKLHFAWFDDQLIALDIGRDQYTVLSAEQSRKIEASIASSQKSRLGFDGIMRDPSPDDSDASRRPGFDTSPIGTSIHIKPLGVSVNCWNLSPGEIRIGAGISKCIKLLFTIHKVHVQSRKKRLEGLIDLIQRKDIKNKKNIPNEFDLASSLNLMCMIYPRKTKCLEWACSLILAGRSYGLDMKLVIGVQNRPFFAHAWVELNGCVIGDHPERRKQLAVIYETA